MWKLIYLSYLIFILSVGAPFILSSEGQDNIATPGQFPYQVLVLQNGQAKCGGALAQTGMGIQYIITSAYCLANLARPLEILAGSIATNGLNQIPAAQRRAGLRFVSHPQYRQSSSKNDIALIFLRGNFRLHNSIQPINLPSQGQNSTGNLTVSGWGGIVQWPIICPRLLPASLGLRNNVQNQLQYRTISVISNSACAERYSTCYTQGNSIFQSNICAGGNETQEVSACQGDSGGPAVGEYRGENILFGIVSWSAGCSYPGVYTKVSEFIDWINLETFD